MTDKYLCFSCNKELGEQDKAFIFDVDYSENPCAENSGHCSEECFYRSTGRSSEYRKILERRELRDKFAMAAMQGILANPAMIDTSTYQTLEWVAKNAYQAADAMLKARG